MMAWESLSKADSRTDLLKPAFLQPSSWRFSLLGGLHLSFSP